MDTKRHGLKDSLDQLRADAEAELADPPPVETPARSTDVLLHEVQVHQIELEMQNETLRQTVVALEESRERDAKRYAELYEFAPVGYLTLSESGRIAEANLTTTTLLGIERNRLHHSRFDHFVAAADADRWQHLFRSVKKGLKGQPLDVLLRQGDGSEVLVHLDCRRDETEVVPGQLRVAITDISERKQVEQQLRESEALFRSIFDNNLDAVLLTGPDGSILAANPEAQRIFGYSNEELRILGQQGVIDASDPRVATASVQHEEEGWFRGELTLIGKGGRRFPAELSSSVFSDGKGRRMTSLLVRDISERQREADLLRQAKREAERANNAKSRFLAAASHDLRQPLSALSIYVNVLKNHVAATGRPLLVNMTACLGSLSELLTDLLDLSKLEAGVVTPNRVHFPLGETLAALLSVHAPEAQSKGLRLHCIARRLTAYTDPVLFQRILGNLIGNAIRYTEHGGVLVACRRRQGKTWIEVWDTGIGIAADKTEEVFEEFKQLGDDARTRGSGLGLAIVAKTASLLGLEYSVRSRRGRGSVFAIELPLGDPTTTSARTPLESGRRPLRIALVDDNALVRDALTLALQGAGHDVVAAVSGPALGIALGGLPPDIVVSDYRLRAGETGFDVITAVRASMGAELPALLITGDTDPKLLRSMTDRGIVVLHKPLDLETLQAYLEDLTASAK